MSNFFEIPSIQLLLAADDAVKASTIMEMGGDSEGSKEGQETSNGWSKVNLDKREDLFNN